VAAIGKRRASCGGDQERQTKMRMRGDIHGKRTARQPANHIIADFDKDVNASM
jgi:hypothetical protein